MARKALRELIGDPGFTPGARDVDGIVDLLADDALEKQALSAIGRAGAGAVDRLRARFESALPPLRARVLRAIGRMAPDARARATLLQALSDGDPKTRRNAAIALGHARDDAEVERALLRAWEADPRVEMRRSIAASLGKAGSALSLSQLREAARSDDAQLARIAERACMQVERTATRDARGRIADDRAPSAPLPVQLLSRAGLEELLADELAAVDAIDDARVAGPGRVSARLRGELRSVFAARTMIAIRFPLPQESIQGGESIEDATARAATSDAARAALGAFTEGAVRYRIRWAEGGHRRAATWDLARAIAARTPELVNDPTRSLWEMVVAATRHFVDVSLEPRLEDPRWPWRRGDVPAASHPTIAAALARVAGVRDDDVVWDPFVGSGAELIERARFGPCRALLGTDLDARALRVARANLDAAGVRATLERADALVHRPRGVSLVVTNPPMGRRSARTPGTPEMLDRFVAHAASVLVPGGRLVWIAPWPKRARAAAERAGMRLEWARTVDMGGYAAEMQRWTKA